MQLSPICDRRGHGQQITVDSTRDTPDNIPDSLPDNHNVNDLAGHHGIPTSSPPTPRAATQRTSSIDEITPSLKDDSPPRTEHPAMLDDPALAVDEAEAFEIISNYLHASKRHYVHPLVRQELLTNGVCPLIDSPANPNQFLTSPMESPFDDFLSTPSGGYDDSSTEFTGPLVADDDGFGASSHNNLLFWDILPFETPPSSGGCIAPPPFPPVHPDNMYSISLPTPTLDTSLPPTPPSLQLSSDLPTSTRKNPTLDPLNPGSENTTTASVNIGGDLSASTYSTDGRTSQEGTQ